MTLAEQGVAVTYTDQHTHLHTHTHICDVAQQRGGKAEEENLSRDTEEQTCSNMDQCASGQQLMESVLFLCGKYEWIYQVERCVNKIEFKKSNKIVQSPTALLRHLLCLVQSVYLLFHLSLNKCGRKDEMHQFNHPVSIVTSDLSISGEVTEQCKEVGGACGVSCQCCDAEMNVSVSGEMTMLCQLMYGQMTRCNMSLRRHGNITNHFREKTSSSTASSHWVCSHTVYINYMV